MVVGRFRGVAEMAGLGAGSTRSRMDPQRPFATANYRIAKEIYSIASSARASNAGGLDNCGAGPSGV